MVNVVHLWDSVNVGVLVYHDGSVKPFVLFEMISVLIVIVCIGYCVTALYK